MSRFAITVVVVFAAGLWALILAHNGWIIPFSFFAPLSFVVGALGLLLPVFNGWIWSWPLINSFVSRPDLRGTWRGTIKSNPMSANQSTHSEPIEVFVVIRQTFSTLHLRLLSPESQSLSLATSLAEEAPEQFALSWIYRSEPRHLAQGRSRVHLGGGLLRLSGATAPSMSGHYWTDRNTSGELELTLVARARVNTYEAARGLQTSTK